MNTSTLSFKLTAFLVAAVTIAITVGGGMYGLLRKVEADAAIRTMRIVTAKNAAYQLLETLVDAQAALQDSLRLKDPDEIEKSIEHFKDRLAAAQQLVKNSADLPAVVGEKLNALVEIDQQAVEKFLKGDNSAAFELMITTAPVHFDALLKVIREHSARIQAAVATDAEAARTSLARTLVMAAIGCSALVLLLTIYGWHFRHSTNRQLRNLASSLGEGATQVAAAAGQVSSASQSLAAGSSEQAASLEETSASLEELTSMTKRNADSAGSAKGLSAETRAAADIGNHDMVEMRQAMDAIKSSSHDIAKIIKSIDEIAFQTNILALNAAVEAARAGEAGAGFAVVAEEVRALAQRSANSAKETAEKIEIAIRNGDHGAVISTKVAQSLGVIMEKARKVDELIAEIATASHEQDHGISQINNAVSQMDQITQSNAANAEETAASSEELSAQAVTLKEAVAQLRQLIGGGERALADTYQPTVVVATSNPVVHQSKHRLITPAAPKTVRQSTLATSGAPNAFLKGA